MLDGGMHAPHYAPRPLQFPFHAPDFVRFGLHRSKAPGATLRQEVPHLLHRNPHHGPKRRRTLPVELHRCCSQCNPILQELVEAVMVAAVSVEEGSVVVA